MTLWITVRSLVYMEYLSQIFTLTSLLSPACALALIRHLSSAPPETFGAWLPIMDETPSTSLSKFYSPFNVKIRFPPYISGFLRIFPVLTILIFNSWCTQNMYLTSEHSSLKQNVTAERNNRNELIIPYTLEMRYLEPQRLSDLPKATQLYSFCIKTGIYISWLSWASFHSPALPGTWFMLFPL